jgi:hypothetical protein
MMNWEGCGSKWPLPNLRQYPNIRLEGLRKIMKDISQDGRSQDRYLKPGSPEYEVGILTSRPRPSVLLLLCIHAYLLFIV